MGRPLETGLTDEVLLGVPVHCQQRSPGTRTDKDTLYITNKQRVASRGVEKTGLPPGEAAAAEEAYRLENPGQGEPNYPDRIYRRRRHRPLLIIHLLAIGGRDDDFRRMKPVVAYSISFPAPTGDEEKIEYVVNTTWLRENYRGDLDDDEMAGDDE